MRRTQVGRRPSRGWLGRSVPPSLAELPRCPVCEASVRDGRRPALPSGALVFPQPPCRFLSHSSCYCGFFPTQEQPNTDGRNEPQGGSRHPENCSRRRASSHTELISEVKSASERLSVKQKINRKKRRGQLCAFLLLTCAVRLSLASSASSPSAPSPPFSSLLAALPSSASGCLLSSSSAFSRALPSQALRVSPGLTPPSFPQLFFFLSPFSHRFPTPLAPPLPLRASSFWRFLPPHLSVLPQGSRSAQRQPRSHSGPRQTTGVFYAFLFSCSPLASRKAGIVSPLALPCAVESLPRSASAHSLGFGSPTISAASRRRPSSLSSTGSSPATPDFLPEYFHHYVDSDAADGGQTGAAGASARYRPGLTAEMERALVGYEFGVRFSRPSDDNYVPGYTQSRIAAATRPHKSLQASTVADALGPRPTAAPRPPRPNGAEAPLERPSGDSGTPRDGDAQRDEGGEQKAAEPLGAAATLTFQPSSPSSFGVFESFPYDAKVAGAPAGDAHEYEVARRREEEERKRRANAKDEGFQVELQTKLLREGVLSIMGSEEDREKGLRFGLRPRGEDAAMFIKKQVPVHRLKLFQWDNLEVASAGGYMPPLHLSLVRATEVLRACHRLFGPEGTPRHFTVPAPSRKMSLLRDAETEAAARALANEGDAHSAEQALEKRRDIQELRDTAWAPHLVGLRVHDQEELLRDHRETVVEDLPAAAEELHKIGFRWEALEVEEDEEEEFSIFLEAFASYISEKTKAFSADDGAGAEGARPPLQAAELPGEEVSAPVSIDPLRPSRGLAPSFQPFRAPPALPARQPPSLLPQRFFKIPAEPRYPEYLWGYPLGAVISELKKGRKFLGKVPQALKLLRAVEFPIQTIEGVERFINENAASRDDAAGANQEADDRDSGPLADVFGDDEGFVEPLSSDTRLKDGEELERDREGLFGGPEGEGASGEESGEARDREQVCGGQGSQAGETAKRAGETDAKAAYVRDMDVRELRNLLADAVNFEEATEARLAAAGRPDAPPAADQPREQAFPVSPYYHLIVPAEFPLPVPLRRPTPRRGLRWQLQALQQRLLAEEEGEKKSATVQGEGAAADAASNHGKGKKKRRGKKREEAATEASKRDANGASPEKETKADQSDGAKPFLGNCALRYPHALFSRRRTEGGFHYAFDKWSFDDVVEAMQYFNDLYEGVHREIGAEEALTFNVLPRGWCIPSPDHRTFPKLVSPFAAAAAPPPTAASVPDVPESLWPEEWRGMPLGKYLHGFRVGDIDAKFHPRRRPLLDRLGLDWGPPLQYLHFTWMKLLKGMRWWMLFRGQPLEQLFPWTEIPEWTFVANICKPEEVQGLKLGYLVHMANRQENILHHYYPHRFEIYKRLNLCVLPADRLLLDFPFKVQKENLPEQGALGYLIPHVPPEQREDV
ncbi:hypothetical protein BESB_014080 [Besnoitia besnoiti]|uniref:Uncharacterized protein n=1 Tax=Besnoitia besnoiti TaxID=94643 RepID=A0A2A9MA35_BESBE|nr:hypothetical protein BESB_014080 [Besnoitia besnoiti]PFH32796.1 hypothetical protein BESB_014080 [Besnoitia besnoiti]